MKKIFFSSFTTFIVAGFLFFLLAPFNQLFATAVCQVSYIPTTTQTGCDFSTEICQAPDLCSQPGGLCHYGFTGTCIPINSHHVDKGSYCQIFDPNDKQGNCNDGLTCNLSQSKTPGIAGKGVCLPNNYTCNPSVNGHITCPDTTTCGYDLYNTNGGLCSTDKNNPICGTCFLFSDFYTKCTCDNHPPGNIGSGKNHYTCTDNTGATDDGSCKNPDLGCWDDVSTATYSDPDVFNGRILNGVQCQTPDQHNGTNPVPPAPPCATPGPDGTCAAVLTAFGTVPTDPAGFISRFFGVLLGAAGSIALILFMRAGYRIMTARGNPESIKEGREQIVAAIIGLMFLVFSFILLQVIGVDLLRLPGS